MNAHQRHTSRVVSGDKNEYQNKRLPRVLIHTDSDDYLTVVRIIYIYVIYGHKVFV